MIEDCIREFHDDEVPEILSVRANDGLPRSLRWVELAPDGPRPKV